MSLFLLVAPFEDGATTKVCFLGHYSLETVDWRNGAEPGESFEVREASSGLDLYMIRNGEYRVIIGAYPPEPFSYDFFECILSEDHPYWEAFMLGDGVRLIGTGADTASVDEVQKGKVRALIRADFAHDIDIYTPFAETSLAGA